MKSFKSLKWLLILSFLIMPFANVSNSTVSAAGEMSDQLILQMNSKVMVHNGVTMNSVQPVTLQNGTTFIALSSISALYGYKVSYNAATKEVTAANDYHDLIFKIGSTIVYGDGLPVKIAIAPYILNGSLMVPVRTWSNLAESTLVLSGKQITLSWNVLKQPTADFAVEPGEIIAGETTVNYIDKSTNPSGQPYVQDYYTGRMDVFPTAGSYTITRQVQDVNGLWSDPYSVTIEVKPQNMPPVANFTTEKPEYRIGEKVNYTDLSTDDNNDIVRRTWTGNSEVFFEAGPKTVTLEVEDSKGLTNSITQTINVTSEVLYTQDEYNKLFKKVGDMIPIDGSSVLNFPALPYKIQDEGSQFVRSNSPEILLNEGIAYVSQLTGQVRFMFHNVNSIGHPVKIYLVATNNNNSSVNVNTGSVGIGGPDPHVDRSGKMAVLRYMNSLVANPAPTTTTIKPGQSVTLLPEISKVALKQSDVFTAYADLYADKELTYRVVVVASGKDPIQEMPNLSIMERNDVHVRGTFNKANRAIEMSDTLGEVPERIMLGDRTMDSYTDGIDEVTGQLELNTGNFGVLYKMRLQHVAPHTLIALNPRGGMYTGAFIVNGQVVQATNTGALRGNGDAAVLYRTGDSAESVEIVFTIAAGSNLPIAMLFLPLPAKRF
ncbi:stalk domain-containing protein [Paenibacillus sepulcri]|uniref:Copper amine oxidase N-terminal domain-containing protein n=1 Tax=Paenibacillus sepulcri TaxID=359917 RepID=A0ABS7C0Q0_9BACL|nr:copper amine oxidase N-terminal domain-containing protein [Paenibacillus sepulcri]